ncbi:MAG: Gfo/Idh/MocA family oxidoreductase [Caulobacteraceae bacterium]|nr:Gfo/Idh/MocA family oxidoreductase [Caulobacteraceae bacterium]
MNAILKAGVIGAGVFGGYHAAKWAGLAGIELTAVFDTDAERAEAIAKSHGARAVTDGADFLSEVDIVSIASPAISHAEWALAALRAGKPIYVEKPLAVSLDDAEAIVREAKRRSLVAACGFIERIALRAIGLGDAPEAPVRFEAVRRGRPSPRNRDVTVILDLMIHDLDLALMLGRGEPYAVEAEGSADEARTEINFDDGLVAIVEASRAAAVPERRLRIAYPSGEVDIDLLQGAVRSNAAFPVREDFAALPEVRDRLGASIEGFLAAVRGEPDRLIASAADGARAVDLALAVELALAE